MKDSLFVVDKNYSSQLLFFLTTNWLARDLLAYILNYFYQCSLFIKNYTVQAIFKYYLDTQGLFTYILPEKYILSIT